MPHLPMKLASVNALASLKAAVKENVDPATVARREIDQDSYSSYDTSASEVDDDDDEDDNNASDVDDDHDHGSQDEDTPPLDPVHQSLPPSPPLNRTPMSKVNCGILTFENVDWSWNNVFLWHR